MPLKTKIEFVGIDKTGRIVSVRDATGVYSASNLGGYGVPNPVYSDIKSIIFTISAYNSKSVNAVRYVRQIDLDHPEYLLSPSVSNILVGQQVDITSATLGTQDVELGLLAFPDGVLDINAYHLTETVSSVVGVKGNMYITGSNLDLIWETVDNVVIDNVIYTVNHNIPTNGGTILYLLEDLKADTTSVTPAYRANIKGYNSSASNCCITEATGAVAIDCKCNKDTEVSVLFNIIMYKIAAQINFNSEDYAKAQKLLEAAQRGCKQLNCNC